jgi:hypothetical protein
MVRATHQQLTKSDNVALAGILVVTSIIAVVPW